MRRSLKISQVPPSAISIILRTLKQKPKLLLPELKSLKLTLAQKNDHFGARHFIQDGLARIRYHNQNVPITVVRVDKKLTEQWSPELEVRLVNGKVQRMNLHNKFSTEIVKDLMDMIRPSYWVEWKAKARALNVPVILGEEKEKEFLKSVGPRSAQPPPPPFLTEFLQQKQTLKKKKAPTSAKVVKSAAASEIAIRTAQVKAQRAKEAAGKKKQEEEAKKAERATNLARKERIAAEAARQAALQRPKTGAAAILP